MIRKTIEIEDVDLAFVSVDTHKGYPDSSQTYGNWIATIVIDGSEHEIYIRSVDNSLDEIDTINGLPQLDSGLYFDLKARLESKMRDIITNADLTPSEYNVVG